MRIFISYTTRDHRDRALAQRITDGLKGRAVDVFYAPRSIRGGAEWKEVLRAELTSHCTHVLVILSAASLASKEVREEIDLALARFDGDRAFRILPLVTGTIAEDPLSRFQQVAYDNDPDEQVENIAAALRLPPQSASERALKPSSHRPGEKGDLVPRLCDRREQEHSFRSAFNRHMKRLARAPQAYFISGAEGDKHGSLVERFQWTFMRDIAIQARNDRDASVSKNDVLWPLSTNLDEAMDELLGELFGVFESRYANSRLPVTPADFRQLTANRPEPVVLVQHEIRSKGWSRITAPLIERYLKFWSDVAALGPGPQFVVFFNLVLCDSDERNAEALSDFVQSLTDEPDERKPFWKRLGSLLGAPDATRAPLPTNIAVTPLPPLEAVRREDVDDWFDQRGQKIGFEKRQRVCEELFRSAPVRRMADVERRLTAIFFEQNLAEGRAS
ncbi:MAG TPA: TIR domain-containing protein [Thermoanaerobaculia bacterium]|nr:TIR domain-containing protein [Thermoanaerobaculia bacterium]